jgi:hypothetical protein
MTFRRHGAALVACLAFFTTAGVSHAALPVLDAEDLQDAREFRGYPVYWLDMNFEGLPLVNVARADELGRLPGVVQPLRRRVTGLNYGTCEVPPGQIEGGCAAPLELQISPVCDTPVTPGRGLQSFPAVPLRGAQGFFVNGRWELWTRHVVIVAFGERGFARRALEALRGLNPLVGNVSATDPFSAPDPRALAGQLPCQEQFAFIGVGTLVPPVLRTRNEGVDITFAGTRKSFAGLTVRDRMPKDGRVVVDVRGLVMGSGPFRGAGVSVRLIGRAPATARVVVTMPAGRFTSLRVRRTADPPRLVLELR